MKKSRLYFPVLAMAAAMLLAIACAILLPKPSLTEQVRFLDTHTNLSLTPYYDTEEDTYYLFLPGYASLDDIAASPYSGVKLSFPGGSFAALPLDETVTVTATSLLGSHAYALQVRQCAELPTLHLQAQDDLIAVLHQDKARESDAMATILDADGTSLLSQMCTISGRGNGTWTGAKRPYTLTFSSPVSLGPFEGTDKLRLLAEASDESKLRNSLVYYAGQVLEFPYASPYLYLNVYAGGEYLGLYGVVTKEEYTKHIDQDGIQAVFEISNGENKLEFFTTGFRKRIHVLYGDLDTIRRQVNRMEEALLSQDWETCAHLIDLPSFAKKYAMEEFFANYDVVYGSQYFYLDEDNVLHCMLPWDYDWTMFSSVTYFNDAQVFDLRAYRDDSWYTTLLESEAFRSQVVSVLENTFTDDFFSLLNDHIAQTASSIGASRTCDMLRWKNFPACEHPIASGFTELSQFQTLFRDYFPQRRAFLTDYFRYPSRYCRVSFIGDPMGNFFIPRGEDLMDWLGGSRILNGTLSGGRSHTWYADGGVTPQDVGPLTEDITFLSSAIGEETVWEDPSLKEKLLAYSGKLVIMASFGLSALALFAAEVRRMGRKEKTRS